MKAAQMIPSNYLKKEDLDSPTIVTIDHLEEKNVAPPDQPEEVKWIMYFREYQKALVLNNTNIQLLVHATGSDDTDDWAGKEVVLYVDPNVSYGGKLIGGLRIRKHETRTPQRAVPQKAAPRTQAARSDSQEHADQLAKWAPSRSDSRAHADQDIPVDDIPF
jgi:hypothetical protein